MEIYKDLSNPASQEFEKLLNSQLSKIQIEEGKIIEGKINKKIIIKDYLKDHRVFMTSVIAALVFGGSWEIHDKDSFKTSFPAFLDIINDLKNIE